MYIEYRINKICACLILYIEEFLECLGIGESWSLEYWWDGMNTTFLLCELDFLVYNYTEPTIWWL